jgi:hypothetical protein
MIDVSDPCASRLRSDLTYEIGDQRRQRWGYRAYRSPTQDLPHNVFQDRGGVLFRFVLVQVWSQVMVICSARRQSIKRCGSRLRVVEFVSQATQRLRGAGSKSGYDSSNRTPPVLSRRVDEAPSKGNEPTGHGQLLVLSAFAARGDGVSGVQGRSGRLRWPTTRGPCVWRPTRCGRRTERRCDIRGYRVGADTSPDANDLPSPADHPVHSAPSTNAPGGLAPNEPEAPAAVCR